MTLYSGILARIEALGPRPDVATLDDIDRTLETVFNAAPVNGGPVRARTRSLDAALALVERVNPSFCWRVHKQVPAEMLPVTNGAFWATCGLPGEQEDARGETPALALLAAMLRALTGQQP